MFEPLLKYSSIFLKEAGLLKVPENVLKQVQDWALSAYFSRLLYLIQKEVKKRKIRRNLRKMLIDRKQSESYKKMEEALREDNVKPITPGYIYGLVLPEFEGKMDPESYLFGTCDFTKNSVNLTIYKNLEKNNYELEIFGSRFGKKILKKDLTEKQLNLFFKKYIADLYSVLNEFDEFVRRFEFYDDSQNLIDESIECKRFIKENIDAGDGVTSIQRKFEFIFPNFKKPVDIYINFNFKNKDSAAGEWDSDSYQDDKNPHELAGFMDFYYEPKIFEVHNLKIVAEAIRNTVRHELQHAVQTLIHRKIYPSHNKEVLQTEKTLDGNMTFFPTQMPKRIRDNVIPSETRNDLNLEHAHRSVEYHTRVADSVDNFKSVINTLPKVIHKAFFETWIDHNFPFDRNFSPDRYSLFDYFMMTISRFRIPRLGSEHDFEFEFPDAYNKLKKNSKMFKSFKERNFEKYKLAVKEFYKEVEYLL